MRTTPEVFYFKQFSIRHDRCSHKVGTDSVLLGAWLNCTQASTALDIGCGSGLLSLMVAQRCNAAIDGVEIDTICSTQAVENVCQSKWKNRIHIYNQSIQEFDTGKKYDLIVTNPPYFVDSLHPPDLQRQVTRHTKRLSFDDLISAVHLHLAKRGKFNLVLPPVEANLFLELAKAGSLYCSRNWSFRSRDDKPVERYLLEMQFQENDAEHGNITLYEKDNTWSENYRALVQPFYQNT
jgi:tRNA1Val (adenine37-N6)-methyltransferase